MESVAQRKNKTLRDMAISMGVIVALALVFSLLNGGFSFSPGKASGGNSQTADVQGSFATADRTTGFRVVPPKGVPAAWHGSSFSMTPAPGTATAPPTARGGWLTETGSYITLIESSGAAPAVLTAEIGAAAVRTTGSVIAGGTQWATGPGVRQEIAWSRVADGVTFVITGNAGPDDFQKLATAVAGG
jgi:hypothetical protein